MQRKLLTLLLFLLSFSSAYAINGVNEKVLIEDKVKHTVVSDKLKQGWYESRLITIGTQFYVKQGEEFVGYKKASDPVGLHLYKKQPTLHVTSSQGLVKTSEQSLGTTVDTSIRTKTKRKNEKKATNVQYDKSKIKQKKKDFQVDANRVNSKNVVQNKSNYDGGHLVDHKFSAQGSHTDNANYVPQHHFYNSWMKEYLVKNASGYLEIPLYTKNPPLIKVMGEDRYDPIPIGILLVPMEGQKILDMYYFPNNQYNYRQCQKNLKITKAIASSMTQKFKLKKELQTLLWPALIYDVRLANENLVQQQAQEALRAGVIDELIEGISCAEEYECEDDDEIIPALGSDVIHQPKVRPSLIYEATESVLGKMARGQANPEAFDESCTALGHFLVEYAIKNALKSELISTNSRIMFANIITDFIECYHQVSGEAMEKIDDIFADTYDDVLAELWRIKDHMSLTDLLFFGHVYHKLSSPFIHDCLMNGWRMIGDMDLSSNIEIFVDVLKIAYEKAKKRELSTEQKQILVELFIEAQNDVAYLICLGYPEEIVEDQIHFLGKAKKRVKKWSQASDANRGTYVTSPNSVMNFAKVSNYNDMALSYLGTSNSMTY